ncbi:MAG: Tim44/TimA family putative adaptor protein [Alphaproteobacteria bacterium]
MNEGFQFLDIIFFAMIAAFILLRLRSVLGRRTGHERRPANPLARRRLEDNEDNEDKVIRLPDAEAPAARGDDFADVGDSALAAGLTQIKLADSSFTREDFLAGARGAFELIVGAYAAGDAKALRPLLADDVYDPFARTISERAAAGHTLETALVSMDGAEIIEAGMNGRTAFVTVRFVSHQINVTRDADGEIVEGDPHDSAEVVDIWTFGRDARSRDPNWKLVATRSPN